MAGKTKVKGTPFLLRMPDTLYEVIRRRATTNLRSANNEMVYLMQQAILWEASGQAPPSRLALLEQQPS
jgi:hypothetical protein